MNPRGLVPYACLAVFLLHELALPLIAHSRRSGERRDQGSFSTFRVAISAGFVLAFGFAHVEIVGLPIRLDGAWAVPVGVVIFCLGATLWVWAMRTLGQWFTRDVRVSGDQTVVRTGPYAWVRHPSYTAMLIEMIGIGLTLCSTLSLLLLFIPTLAATLYRVRVEERALRSALGPAYAEYASSVKRFVPHLF